MMLKKLLVHTRRSLKLITIMSIALLLIIGIIAYFYKISYSVTIDGQFVGYTDNKSKLQAKINNYVEADDNSNVAFVQIDNLPEYKLCFIKRTIETSDEKIFNLIQSEGTNYYRYYAILDNQEEKLYVATFTEAEEIVNKLKEQNSANIETITIDEKYETEQKEMSNVETAVASLYVKPQEITVASVEKTPKSVNTSTTISKNTVNLGISLIKPLSGGVISSRFGARSRIRSSAHTGLDIATSTGTPIKAAASGTVTFSGRKGSYGKLIVITHSNGVQTYYGHCSELYVSEGEKVSQGQTIGAVGNTGNSTGPHLHFEIRVNGIAYNPQNYLY